MFRSHSLRPAALALSAVAALMTVACEQPGEPVVPTMAAVAGEYDANESFGALSFTTTAEGETINWLEAGASFSLTLNADGTVSGRLFIPGGDENGADMDADMAGTWTLLGNTVTFEQDADTFVRDMPFTYIDGVLEGDHIFDDVRVRVVLVQG